ncbi:MAG: lipoprotein-releasing ABC transporter permease subunit [Deltaproteobacteria bacterium]|nr:lipoprotein-releasing ABC transporter permease subunit [Deltaproteobacteria bacterium]MCB9487442.1 lipoprotein-releasing ABC transporter permease subunit [Deltaproteobacteria bacterium]
MAAVFERFVGLRFLRPQRKRVFLSVITMISSVGVAVGVATLIVVISVISGFQDYMQEKQLDAYSHMIVLAFNGNFEDYEALQEKVQEYPHVVASSPFVYSELMITFRDEVQTTVLRGVDPESFGKVSSIGDNLIMGQLSDLNTRPMGRVDGSDPNEPERAFPPIILGSELAARLHVFPGDVVGLVTPFGESTPMGIMPKMKPFIVTGMMELGLFEFDSKFSLILKKDAQAFFGLGDEVSGLEVKLDDIWAAPELAVKMNTDLGWPYKVKDWTKLNANLFAAIKLEKLVMFIILSIIILVASLNIFSNLYLMVMDKKRSIAILRTMGASGASIRRIFLVQGVYIGIVGAVAGLILGTGLCFAQIHFKLVRIDPEVYLIDTLPMKLDPVNFVVVAAAALAMALLATWIPARLAANLDPVRVLRYD